MATITSRADPAVEPKPGERGRPPVEATGSSGRVADFQLKLSHATIAVRQTAGPGVPVLFLHGNSCAKEVFDRQLASLGRSHRCISIDLPGHGASSDAFDPKATYSIAGLADAAVEVLEALDIDQVVLVGWSIGGHVALEMVASFPGVVGALVSGAPPVRSGLSGLLSGFRLGPLTALLGNAELTPDQAYDLARAVVGQDFAPDMVPMIRRADGRARELLFRSMFRGVHADQRATVEHTGAAIAVVNGEDDPFVRMRAFARPRYANLWSGVCYNIPGGGHAPFINAAPLYNQLLTRFAKDMDVRSRQLLDAPQLVFSG